MPSNKREDFSKKDREDMDLVALKLMGKTLTQYREESVQSSLKVVRESQEKEKKKDPPSKTKERTKNITNVDSDNRRAADLRDACQMAEWFDDNKDDDDTYRIKEGWDLFDIIHSLVVRYRSWKAMLIKHNENVLDQINKK